jgi:hypothetical protein
MSYLLRLDVIAPVAEVPITEEQALEASRAHSALKAAFALEETYDLLVANFLELDQEALCSAARYVVQDSRTYEEFFEQRALPNRRIVNLLSAARLYLDSVPQNLPDCVSNSNDAVEAFRKATSAQFDSRFSYRFMEALRNYVQHNGLAVHALSHISQWSGKEPDLVNETRLSLFSNKKHFEENNKFKKKALAEMPESVELLQASREYLEGLGTVHDTVRGLISTTAHEARTVIQNLIDSYALANDGHTLGLFVMRVHASGLEKVTPVILEWDDVRMKLAARNTRLSNLGSRVAASRLVGIPWVPE